MLKNSGNFKVNAKDPTSGLSFSAKYTRLENVKTATPTRSINKPSSLYAYSNTI